MHPKQHDEILISNITVPTICGVNDWEKKAKRNLIIDIKVRFFSKKAGNSDDILDTVDYDALTSLVVNYISNNSFNLIESVAEAIATLTLKQFFCEQVEITVKKPYAMPLAQSVSIKITRDRE